ncbi:hypothetical protein K3495_g7725 [Podosphaera aphanis]|nr:hypothetical protein K3495_g7725 [Podosphaera aphanis]
MNPSHALDLAFDPSTPRSWRNKEKLEKAMQSMSNLNSSMESVELPSDPDAQASIADFLDFTEYLPSDMVRSLTLIGHLDQTYHKASTNIHSLTMDYGQLPSVTPQKRPDPTQLRADISKNLEGAINARTLALAEAHHMTVIVQRHYSRIQSILSKLQAISDNYPSSREASPAALQTKSPIAARAPKITLRMDGAPPGENRPRKNCALRITVPGEVLAPYEIDFPSYADESSEGSDSEVTPLVTKNTLATDTQSGPKLKLKLTNRKEKRHKKEKVSRPPRAPGTLGTNVHSSVAGISTSNALAQLQPPPSDAKLGDKDLPWLRLNAWELAKLRKRMKKNAIWSPSDTMIARELKSLGRGIEAYQIARQAAEAEGRSMAAEEPPQLRGETVHAEGAMSVEALRAIDPQIFNLSVKLNEIKKQEREKELTLPAEEAERAACQMATSVEVIKDSFDKKITEIDLPEEAMLEKQDKKPAPSPPVTASNLPVTASNLPVTVTKPLAIATKSPAKAQVKKRKRECEMPIHSNRIKPDMLAQITRVPLKKYKGEILSPPVAKKTATPSIKVALPEASNLPAIVSPVSNSIEVLKKPANSILPPSKEVKKPPKRDLKSAETAANSRPRRTSIAPTLIPPPPVPDQATLPKRPTSSRSLKASLDEVIPTGSATVDRQRRTSTAQTITAPESRTQSKRNKRPAPGVLTTNSGGSTTVSIGRRSAATRKKPGSKKEKKDGSTTQEIFDEVDDEGNLIDPDEPRYCHCNRVSFGTMIGCEGANCEKEWFHLECVGLLEIPPRTTKWYCPLCRVTLGIGEKGEVNARGMKKFGTPPSGAAGVSLIRYPFGGKIYSRFSVLFASGSNGPCSSLVVIFYHDVTRPSYVYGTLSDPGSQSIHSLALISNCPGENGLSQAWLGLGETQERSASRQQNPGSPRLGQDFGVQADVGLRSR